MIEIDNSAVSVDVYLKIYDNLAPTVGTTAADWVVRCPSRARRSCVIPGGYEFSNGLSFATVIGADQASTMNPPGGSVIVRIVTSP
jgi:hypothetical protein